MDSQNSAESERNDDKCEYLRAIITYLIMLANKCGMIQPNVH